MERPLQGPLARARSRYREALTLQRALFGHRPTTTCSSSSTPTCTRSASAPTSATSSCDPASVGADLVRTDRGGDVTYHGPGQLVGYPILTVAGQAGRRHGRHRRLRALRRAAAHRRAGRPRARRRRGRLDDYPGVWVEPDGPRPRKIAAIGVKLTRGRTMHGFALNVAPDLAMFGHIVPCGIADKASPRWRPRASDATCGPSSTRRRPGGRDVGGGPGRPPGRGVAPRSRRPVAVQSRGGPGRSADAAVQPGAAPAPHGRPRPCPVAGPAERHVGPPAGSPRRGRGRRGRSAGDRAQARWLRAKLDLGPAVRSPATHPARPRPRHGVRGGRLPEHLRVLVARARPRS